MAVQTLSEFIIERQAELPHATGEFTRLFGDITIAAKVVNREVNKAGLVDILGAAGSGNIQGEEQQKLDVFANTLFMDLLRNGGECRAIASEEYDDIVVLDGIADDGKYLVSIDPLDGSSNIDVNVSIGTIFSIFRRKKFEGPVTVDEFFRPGTEQVAAGYVIYGSSTMLVYTSGKGVNGFTLDSSIGEFCLSHPNMKIPEDGSIYSINEGNLFSAPKGVQDYVHKCKERQYSARYIGSLVADFHRNLLKGGIYMYPSTEKAPNGKLRLLYECSPLAFLIEQAGGYASDGNQRIMEIVPTDLHQRVPYYVGSPKMVAEVEQLMDG
ncbi:MAG: class 1 fructose-bisphosphatase [Flavobacteriales bacterium]|nr:class 1 fructose-bisphosphatase [Flavobacteriales bacterium]